MGKDDDAFVKKAFRDAIRAARIDTESHAATASFNENFTAIIATFITTGNGGQFMDKNKNEDDIRSISTLAEICFYAGFRNGVIYKTKKKQ